MDREKAKAIVSDPYQPATHTGVGFYVPTAEFQAQREHIAVMDEDTGGMLAITGPVVPTDEENNIKSLCEAVVYAGAFQMLELVKNLASGGFSEDYAETEARGILASLRAKMNGLQPGGTVNAEGLRNCVMHKLGLIHASFEDDDV